MTKSLDELRFPHETQNLLDNACSVSTLNGKGNPLEKEFL
jgi:hypothetical protein